MKVLLFPAILILAGAAIYYYSRKTKKQKHPNKKAITIIVSVVIVLLGLGAFGMYHAATMPDTQCKTMHAVNYPPPTKLETAVDYFHQGNYDYDLGQCERAISDYTQALRLEPSYAHALNNRAYTFMRLQMYSEALSDLNQAIHVSPDYTQALMNRGDLRNYYFDIDRDAAIADYHRVLTIEGKNGNQKSVCGHLFLAKHNGWNLGTLWGVVSGELKRCE